MKSLIAILGLGLVITGCGSDDPEGSAAAPEDIDDAEGDEQVTVSLEGLSPLEKLVFTLGGTSGVENVEGLRVTSSGKRYLPHEGFAPDEDPVEANDFERTVSFDLENRFVRVDTSREIRFLFPGEEEYFDIVRGNLGVSSQPFFGAPLGDLSSDRVAAIQTQELLLSPHALVSRVGSRISDGADDTLDGVPHHVLRVDIEPRMNLWVDVATGQLSKVETLEHDFYQRDVLVSVEFEGWQSIEAGGGYPSTVRLIRDGLLLLEQEVSDFELNPSFDPDTFEFPAESSPEYDPTLFARGARSTQWYYLLGSIGLPFSGVDTLVNSTEVAPGVRQLQGGSHHSFLVEQSAGLVLVDAPLHQDRGGALLDSIETQFPNKPIAFVVASHFHEDHVAGIREVLGATDAALVVHESTEAFWRETLEARSTLYPDSLARNPRDIEIITVPDDGSYTLEDAEHPVELYDMNADHANDLLLTRDVTSNTVFVVDIYSPGFGTPFEPQALNATILDNQIPTETVKIVGGHGGEVHNYAQLEGFLQ